MRVYRFSFFANGDYIKEKATIKLNNYNLYDGPIAALNDYMYQNVKNDMYFFAYRESGDVINALFFFDEKKRSFTDAYDDVLKNLGDAFQISRVDSEPAEITLEQYFDDFREGKRKHYFASGRYDLMSSTTGKRSDWVYDYYNFRGDNNFRYRFQEFIIPDEPAGIQDIYDPSFLNELSNIEDHENSLQQSGIPVHYNISCRSREAADEMTRMLTHTLYNAGRLNTKRVGILDEMKPDAYKGNYSIEEVIEMNIGGTFVFDLSKKFGYEGLSYTNDYNMLARYIVDLFKKYRNQCLFIFTYHMDDPGIAYQVLPEIRKMAISVDLREGRGDRKAATSYLENLIGRTEYAEYAAQAGEFMEMYAENDFSQTDILMACEQFGPWCVNRNILHAYDYDQKSDYLLDRDLSRVSSYESLQKLIGLASVKKQIDNLIAAFIVEKERKKYCIKQPAVESMHMIFAGNPGTAKTTVAKLFAGIAKEKGILKSGAFIERNGVTMSTNPSEFIRAAFSEARGGVLFIDEAYAMRFDSVTTLIQEMENHRDEVIVILAGYNDSMKDFLKLNEGLKSRIPNWIDFPDYSADELTDIFRLMVEQRGFSVEADAIPEARYIFEKARIVDDFGNGRYVRNLIDHATINQASRLMATHGKTGAISRDELFFLTKEDILNAEEGKKAVRREGEALQEFDSMIGLKSVKEIIHKAIANYKMNKLCLEKGIPRGKASMHMVFTGNPGTAKTTVARLLAEILKDERVLSTGNFIEVGRADLVGQFVGATAPLVKQKFHEAQGGVLFIDEAYALCDDYRNGYGDEAINTIVQEMENHREDVIVIFAGYPEPMKQFIERNPGLRSRIAFEVSFEDYSTEELCEITKLMLSRQHMTITDAAMDKLSAIYAEARADKGFGNGRFVRKMLEEAAMNQAQRIFTAGEEELTDESLSTIEEYDIPEHKMNKQPKQRRIGLAS